MGTGHVVRKPKTIPLAMPLMTATMVQKAAAALRNERFLRGESVEKFEAAFTKLSGTKHAVALNNGTNALLFALQALGVKSGDRVLTTSASYIATANSIVMAGAEPVFGDIEPTTANLDPAEVEKILRYGSIKAIIPVHLYGRPAAFKEFRQLADQYGAALVEDACQAHGAKLNGKPAGSWGDAAAFSFYPSKNMHVGGDGGMLTTDRDDVADYVRSVRDGGRALGKTYLHTLLGTTARLNTVNAAIGLEQLKQLRAWTKKRVALAKRYQRELQGVDGLTVAPPVAGGAEAVFHLLTVRTARRDELAAFLKERAIETGVHYPVPIHKQPIYASRVPRGLSLPHTERWAEETLSLPLFPTLTTSDQDRVIEAVRDFFGQRGKRT
ncbi:MAG TPA: DegT/DnrJ/EryC1/StrS family aminotransferase [Candidatus Thermoplasmatota archaeon]